MLLSQELTKNTTVHSFLFGLFSWTSQPIYLDPNTLQEVAPDVAQQGHLAQTNKIISASLNLFGRKIDITFPFQVIFGEKGGGKLFPFLLQPAQPQQPTPTTPKRSTIPDEAFSEMAREKYQPNIGLEYYEILRRYGVLSQNPQDYSEFSWLDPSAGNGLIIRQVAQRLGVLLSGTNFNISMTASDLYFESRSHAPELLPNISLDYVGADSRMFVKTLPANSENIIFDVLGILWHTISNEGIKGTQDLLSDYNAKLKLSGKIVIDAYPHNEKRDDVEKQLPRQSTYEKLLALAKESGYSSLDQMLAQYGLKLRLLPDQNSINGLAVLEKVQDISIAQKTSLSRAAQALDDIAAKIQGGGISMGFLGITPDSLKKSLQALADIFRSLDQHVVPTLSSLPSQAANFFHLVGEKLLTQARLFIYSDNISRVLSQSHVWNSVLPAVLPNLANNIVSTLAHSFGFGAGILQPQNPVADRAQQTTTTQVTSSSNTNSSTVITPTPPEPTPTPKINKRLFAFPIVLLLAACSPITINDTPTPPVQPSPTPTPVCDYGRSDNYKYCNFATQKTIDVLRINDMQQLANNPLINQEFKNKLMHIIEIMTLLYNQNKLEIYQYNTDMAVPAALYFCNRPTSSFQGTLLLSQPNIGSDAQILGTIIHEAEHMTRAYDRSGNNPSCSDQHPNEENEVSFDALYFAGLARNTGFPDNKNLVKETGSDPIAITYSIFVPSGINPNSEIVDMIISKLSSRYLYVRDGLYPNSTDKNTTDTIKKTESEFQQLFSSNKEMQKVVDSILKLKLADPNYFPLTTN